MGVDEATVGVLVDKLKAVDRTLYYQVVAGFTFWGRILRKVALPKEQRLELEDYHSKVTKGEVGSGPVTALTVASILREEVERIQQSRPPELAKAKVDSWSHLNSDKPILHSHALKISR